MVNWINFVNSHCSPSDTSPTSRRHVTPLVGLRCSGHWIADRLMSLYHARLIVSIIIIGSILTSTTEYPEIFPRILGLARSTIPSRNINVFLTVSRRRQYRHVLINVTNYRRVLQ